MLCRWLWCAGLRVWVWLWWTETWRPSSWRPQPDTSWPITSSRSSPSPLRASAWALLSGCVSHYKCASVFVCVRNYIFLSFQTASKTSGENMSLKMCARLNMFPLYCGFVSFSLCWVSYVYWNVSVSVSCCVVCLLQYMHKSIVG